MDPSIATEAQGIELLYRGQDIHGIPFEDPAQFNTWCGQLEIEPLLTELPWSKEFDIPQGFKDLDVEAFIVEQALAVDGDKADFDQRLARVQLELSMFHARNLYPVLQLLIHIVDTMRKHNIVWGVGRGSSVASYCLYLIGIHQIDSVLYDLPITEFLK